MVNAYYKHSFTFLLIIAFWLSVNIVCAQTKQTAELIDALESKDPKTIFPFLRESHKIDDPEDYKLLVEPLMDIVIHENFRNNYIRVWAVCFLTRCGDERTAELFISLVSDENPDVRFCAAYGLSGVNDERAFALLVELLEDSEPRVREAAINSMGIMRDPRAVEPLVAVLQNDSDLDIKAVAAETLGEIGDPRAIGPLIAALREQNPVGSVAEKALAKIGEPAVAPLMDLMNGGDLHRGVVRTLEKIGKPAVDPILSSLKSEDYYIRREAIEVLGNIGDESAIEHLIPVVLHDEDLSLKAVDSLAKIGNPRGFELLIRGFLSEEESVCNRLEHALVFRPKLATQPLIAAIDEFDGKARVYALFTLLRIDKEKGEERVTVLAGDTDLGETSRTFSEILKQGEKGKEWTLIYSLIMKGNRFMAMEFYKRGNSLLKLAAEKWAYMHGLYFYEMF